MEESAPAYFSKFKRKGELFFKNIPMIPASIKAIPVKPIGGFVISHIMFAAYRGKYATHSVFNRTSEYITFRVILFFDEAYIENALRAVNVNDFAKPDISKRSMGNETEFYLEIYLNNSRMSIYNGFNEGLIFKA